MTTAQLPLVLPMFGPVRRGAQLVLGLLGYGASMAMMLHGHLGAMPWGVFHEGLSIRFDVPVGATIAVVSSLVMLGWIPLRQRPGIGTVANFVILAISVDPALAILARITTDPAVATRLVLAIGGLVLNGISTAAYIGVRLGPGPRDGLMTGVMRRTRWPVWRVKAVIETTVVILGATLGGRFGGATVASALLGGFVVQWATRFLAPHGLIDH